MRFGSLFSGIEAASVAWAALGWECAWLAEVEPFPCAVLAHHYPEVPNLGDVTAADFVDRARAQGPVDLVCGGPPCQAFSVAGLRHSLEDERGNLTLRFMEIVNAIDPRFVVFENVPGVLNTKDNAFGCLLAGLVGENAPIVPVGGRWTDAGVVDGPRRSLAWRVLDAQYFGLAQRRRRVFLLAGRAGERPHPAEVLFEPERLRRDTPPSREEGKKIAKCINAGTASGGQRYDLDSETFVAALTSCGVGTCGADDNQAQAGHLISSTTAHTLRGRGFDASEDGTGRGVPLVPVPILEAGKRCGLKADTRDGIGIGRPGDPMFTLQAGAQHAVAFQDRFRGDDGRGYDRPPAVTEGITGSLETVKPWCVAFESRFARNGRGAPSEILPPLKAQNGQTGKGDGTPLLASGAQVRRLTPRECERLQGFSDDFTLIPNYMAKLKPHEVEEMAEYLGIPLDEAREVGATPDGPRYKALGNSMAVPVVRWIGERLVGHTPNPTPT